MGFLPIRDMELFLIDSTEDFAANVLLAGFFVAEDAFRRSENGDAESVKHMGNVLCRGVLAQPWGADALDVFDDRLLFVVFQFRHSDLLFAFARDAVVFGDIALFHEHIQNAQQSA